MTQLCCDAPRFHLSPGADRAPRALICLSCHTPDAWLKFQRWAKTIPMHQCSTGRIRATGYDEHHQVLRINFDNGGRTAFLNFPRERFDEFMNEGGSYGAFMSRSIDARFRHVQLVVTSDLPRE